MIMAEVNSERTLAHAAMAVICPAEITGITVTEGTIAITIEINSTKKGINFSFK